MESNEFLMVYGNKTYTPKHIRLYFLVYHSGDDDLFGIRSCGFGSGLVGSFLSDFLLFSSFFSDVFGFVLSILSGFFNISCFLISLISCILKFLSFISSFVLCVFSLDNLIVCLLSLVLSVLSLSLDIGLLFSSILSGILCSSFCIFSLLKDILGLISLGLSILLLLFSNSNFLSLLSLEFVGLLDCLCCGINIVLCLLGCFVVRFCYEFGFLNLGVDFFLKGEELRIIFFKTSLYLNSSFKSLFGFLNFLFSSFNGNFLFLFLTFEFIFHGFLLIKILTSLLSSLASSFKSFLCLSLFTLGFSSLFLGHGKLLLGSLVLASSQIGAALSLSDESIGVGLNIGSFLSISCGLLSIGSGLISFGSSIVSLSSYGFSLQLGFSLFFLSCSSICLSLSSLVTSFISGVTSSGGLTFSSSGLTFSSSGLTFGSSSITCGLVSLLSCICGIICCLLGGFRICFGNSLSTIVLNSTLGVDGIKVGLFSFNISVKGRGDKAFAGFFLGLHFLLGFDLACLHLIASNVIFDLGVIDGVLLLLDADLTFGELVALGLFNVLVGLGAGNLGSLVLSGKLSAVLSHLDALNGDNCGSN
jgi:hypothetical protein